MAFVATTSCGSDKGDTYDPTGKYPILGIDISSHNGFVDFNQVKDNGIDFVYLKATEGTDFKDKSFVRNYNAAKQAGLKVGAYHFFRFDSPGYMQGLNFLNSLEGREVDLPLVIDVEDEGNPVPASATHVAMELTDMVSHLVSHGRKVMLYTNKRGFSRYISRGFEPHDLWVCSLGSEPAMTKPWKLWQYSHHGRVPGIEGPVDMNVFSGTHDQWEEWVEVPKAQ